MIRPRFLYCVILLFVFGKLSAQKRYNTLLWEISGKGLHKRSYLFGTNHLFDGTWLDSFSLVKQTLDHAEVVVGESLSPKKRFGEAKQFKPDTTGRKSLHELFSDEEYALVDDYMKSIGLSGLDTMPANDPSVVMRIFYAILGKQTKMRLSMKENEESSIDRTIETRADAARKKFIGLDQFDTATTCIDSMPVFTYEAMARGIVFLVTDLKRGGKAINAEIDRSRNEFIEWSELNIQYNLGIIDPRSHERRIKKWVIQRNEKWMMYIPGIIQSNACFIAVGLRHLKFKEGLIERLRAMGYTVTPVPIVRKRS